MTTDTTRHRRRPELHFTGGDTLRDIVIGMSDGLTVPFALAAGISGAIQATRLIVTAGLAEIAAGSIAMGLGGYLATKSQTEHFDRERERERAEVAAVPEAEAGEVLDALQAWGLTDAEAAPVVTALRRRPESWVDFMMRFELGLERPDPARALTSAVTIGGAYVAGGLLPLVPYMLVSRAGVGLAISCLVTLAALFAFGFFKGRFTRVAAVKSGLQTVVVGGVAAAAAFALARLISGA